MKKLLNLLLVITFLFSGVSCQKDENLNQIPQDTTKVTKDMVVNNDLSSLDGRIVYVNDSVYTFGDTITTKSSKGSNGSITIQVVAKLSSPKYDGSTLQANHIRIVDGYAYIGYNTQGEKYLGGVDIVNISSATNPKLISNAIFISPITGGKDVSSIDVELDGSSSAKCSKNVSVWIAGAEENNPLLETPALVEKYELNSSNQFKSSTEPRHFYGLPGNVGTDVKVSTINGVTKIYATSGIGGGLTVLNDTLKKLDYFELTNARSVDVNSKYEIALGGNPGHLVRPNFWNKEIGGATDPEAKSIVRLYSNESAKCNYNLALAALGEDGVKCFDLTSSTPEKVVSSLPRPTVPAGADSWEYVTNGVSISNGWVYIANGSGGLDIAKLDPYTGKLTWLGNINLGSSVNFVEASCNYVFVATGLGGLTILKVKEN